MESRKRWMLAGLSVKGSIVVDGGAAKVLREDRRSLLPAGISDVQGSFARGEAVAVVDDGGRRIACGIANYASGEICESRGCARTGSRRRSATTTGARWCTGTTWCCCRMAP